MHAFVRLRESINLPVSIELFDDEHSSPRALLLRCEAWRHRGGCAQHAIWNSATSCERTNRQTRGSSRRKVIQSEAVFAPCGWRRVVRVRRTVFSTTSRRSLAEFAAPPSNCELPRLRLCYTIMFPNYCWVCAGIFRFSGSNFTRRHEPTPRDCCRQEKSMWQSR